MQKQAKMQLVSQVYIFLISQLFFFPLLHPPLMRSSAPFFFFLSSPSTAPSTPQPLPDEMELA